MHQRDMERFAFLFLCEKRDRDILMGKEKMTFSDFDRLTYITDFLGLKLYNLEIWNTYSEQFTDQFQRLEQLYEDTFDNESWDTEETDIHDQWIQEFCRQVSDRRNRKKLEEIVKQQYQEKGLDDV